MFVFGHPWITSPRFKKVFSHDDILKLSNDQIALLEPLVDSHELAHRCKQEDIDFAVTVSSVREAVLANALGACYLVCEEDDAALIQPIAENYIFDTKVLALIVDEKDIAKIARIGIDGVLFPEAIC